MAADSSSLSSCPLLSLAASARSIDSSAAAAASAAAAFARSSAAAARPLAFAALLAASALAFALELSPWSYHLSAITTPSSLEGWQVDAQLEGRLRLRMHLREACEVLEVSVREHARPAAHPIIPAFGRAR